MLINLSGGSIKVESEESAWCEFSFTLPVPPAAHHAKQGAEKKGK